MNCNVVHDGLKNIPNSAKELKRIAKQIETISKQRTGHLGDILALLASAKTSLATEFEKIQIYFNAEKTLNHKGTIIDQIKMKPPEELEEEPEDYPPPEWADDK